MAQKKIRNETHRKHAAVHLVLWFVLIISGIVAKRVYGHPDLMVFFHLPAAVFLVIGSYNLSRPFRERYKKSLEEYQLKH